MDNTDDYLSIFLLPPNMEELENRIRNRRTEDESVIQKRLKKAKGELEVQSRYHYTVCNTTPEAAANEIKQIIKENIAK